MLNIQSANFKVLNTQPSFGEAARRLDYDYAEEGQDYFNPNLRISHNNLDKVEMAEMDSFEDEFVPESKSIEGYEKDYNQNKQLVKDFQNDIENIMMDTDANMPKSIKGLLKGLSIGASAILGGMAVGWGAKKSISTTGTLVKSNTFQKVLNSARKQTSKVTNPIIDAFKSGKTKTVDAIKKNSLYNKIAESTFAEKLTKMFNRITENSFVKKMTDKFSSVSAKVKAITGAQVEKAVVGTVGTCGGVASGITAAKGEQV